MTTFKGLEEEKAIKYKIDKPINGCRSILFITTEVNNRTAYRIQSGCLWGSREVKRE